MKNSNSKVETNDDSELMMGLILSAPLVAIPMLPKKAKCYNCKFAGQQFKLGNKMRPKIKDYFGENATLQQVVKTQNKNK